MILVPGGDQEALLGDGPRLHLVLRRLLGEDQADGRLVLLLGAGRRVVHLEDERRPLGNLLGRAFGADQRQVAGRRRRGSPCRWGPCAAPPTASGRTRTR